MNKKYERYINYIVSDIQAPYFKNMEENYGLSEKEYEFILSKVFNQPVTIEGKSIDDHNGNNIYSENSDGYWYKYEYDPNGYIIYWEDSDGYWAKYEYDEQGNRIYYENSDDYWEKYEYDELGNVTYLENNNDYWEKYEYE